VFENPEGSKTMPEQRWNAETLSSRYLLTLPITFFVPLVVVLLTSLPISASLGGDVASVRSDQAYMKGSLRIAHSEPSYQVHEIQSPSGAKVREYVSGQGRVFAIAWEGPGFPDMQQLLGNYFDQYSRAVQNNRSRRAPISVHEPGLTVEVSGHPRAFKGRVYIPEMLPHGMTPDNIK
jgi:hypothetical protein